MPKIENKILSDHVYEQIREMILNGELTPGEKINKNVLSERLGVSITPVNASISRLAGEGFIDQRSRYGFFIKSFSCREMQELFAVRAGLEGIAIRLCIEEGKETVLTELSSFFQDYSLPLDRENEQRYTLEDRNFHSKIVEYSGNTMIQEMNESFAYVRRSYQHGLVRRPEETLEEHLRIINALKKRDALHAQEMLIRHLLTSRDALKAHCSELEQNG